MMKRVMLIFPLLLACIFLSASLMSDSQPKSAKLDISELSFDFGRVPREAKVVHDFLLKNTGTDTLKILNVKPG